MNKEGRNRENLGQRGPFSRGEVWNIIKEMSLSKVGTELEEKKKILCRFNSDRAGDRDSPKGTGRLIQLRESPTKGLLK